MRNPSCDYCASGLCINHEVLTRRGLVKALDKLALDVLHEDREDLADSLSSLATLMEEKDWHNKD